MRYLVDTNIFLEILLNESKKETCETFIAAHSVDLYISDFAVNSIGIILFRLKRFPSFEVFLNDLFPNIHIARLQDFSYHDIVSAIKKYKLDFDDAYQFIIAKEYSLELATLDSDFKKIEADYSVLFL